jgi:hypothetical protein
MEKYSIWQLHIKELNWHDFLLVITKLCGR